MFQIKPVDENRVRSSVHLGQNRLPEAASSTRALWLTLAVMLLTRWPLCLVLMWKGTMLAVTGSCGLALTVS